MLHYVTEKPFIDEVEGFITRRFKKDSDWTSGNCYWFAAILTIRFPQLKIWYESVEGHFLAGDESGSVFFDWLGLREQGTLWGKPMLWTRLMVEDSSYAERVKQYCIK